jgi:predicted nucleotidyltransferase
MTAIDLEPRDLDTVRAILRRHVPEYEVRAFGSRVRGTNRRTSDLDLAIMTETPIDAGRLGALRDDFSESELPFKVDLVDWAATAENFRRIIEQAYEVLQTGKVPSR